MNRLNIKFGGLNLGLGLVDLGQLEFRPSLVWISFSWWLASVGSSDWVGFGFSQVAVPLGGVKFIYYYHLSLK